MRRGVSSCSPAANLACLSSIAAMRQVLVLEVPSSRLNLTGCHDDRNVSCHFSVITDLFRDTYIEISHDRLCLKCLAIRDHRMILASMLN